MAIVDRAKALILQPAQEWRVIAAEPADLKTLFLGYAMPLAAIPAVAGFIGAAIFAGFIGAAVGARVGTFTLLQHAILGYLFGLVGIWVWSRIIAYLAPRFDGQVDDVSALKLAVYSPTAAWLAGAFAVIPPLGILGLLGLWSLYTFYRGAPILTRVPEDKLLGFTLAVIAVGIVVNIIVGLFAGLFL